MGERKKKTRLWFCREELNLVLPGPMGAASVVDVVVVGGGGGVDVVGVGGVDVGGCVCCRCRCCFCCCC